MEAKLKLGINGWRIHGRRTGIGRYLLNIIKYWTADAVDGRFAEINFYTPLPVNRAEIPLPENIRERIVGPNWRMLVWENLRMAAATNDDVLFCPSYTRPLLTGRQTVVTTHDVTLHMHPELYPRTGRLFYDHLYRWSARRATRVITATETVKEDVVRSYGVPPDRIRVVPLGIDEIFRPMPGDPRVEEVRQRYLGSAAPFFLFVGKFTIRRNVPKLLQAFAELKHRTNLPHKLLMIGLNTTELDVATMAVKERVSDYVRHREYVSDEDLALLYNAAEVFIMPSTFETLSLPVMEAQASGTPVISIDTVGLREITGGAALLIKNAVVPEIVEAMQKLATDLSLCRELSERGLVHARTYSWPRCSAETLSVLEESARLR